MKRIYFLIVALTLGGTAQAATWYVDDSVSSSGAGNTEAAAFKSVQEGIDAASDGDTVIVAEGNYVENIFFKGKNIMLRSTAPLNPLIVASTRIVGSQNGSVVSFSGTEDATCMLSGFTITNGKVDYGAGILGGWDPQHSHAVIQNNVIIGNTASQEGGGLYGCHGLIKNNTIQENSAGGSDLGAGGGGGLAQCQGTIEGNIIFENHGPLGGALWDCDGVIRNNEISGNAAGEYLGGGGGVLCGCDGVIENNLIRYNTGMALADCDATIRGNIIAENSAQEACGGLFLCDGTISTNVIARNSCENGVGGLYMCAGTIQNNRITGNQGAVGGLVACDGLIRNNTIAGNVSTEPTAGGGLFACQGQIVNSIIWGNSEPQLVSSSSPTYCCVQGFGGGDGNIGTDPRFIDPDGPDNAPDTYEDNDFRLTPASACIDRGLNEDWMSNVSDLDGNPRIWRGLFAWTVDMGAYEYESRQFQCVQIATFCLPPPGGCGVTLTWNSRPGDNYMILSCCDPDAAEWIPEGTIVSAGEETNWIDPSPASVRKFYRIGLQ